MKEISLNSNRILFNGTDLSHPEHFNLNVAFNAGLITSVDPEIGFLHRSIEKIMEHKTYLQNITYIDHLDPMYSAFNEHAYVLAIEKLLQITPPTRAQYIRVMFDELTRILSHLIWLDQFSATLGVDWIHLDLQALICNILDCYEAICGTRSIVNYYKPGGVAKDLPIKLDPTITKHTLGKTKPSARISLLDFISKLIKKIAEHLNKYYDLLTNNTIWKQRTINIGKITTAQAIEYGFSGPILRATGSAWDLRKTQPYAIYSKLDFKVPTGTNGDSYDRYQVRMAEIVESIKIIEQVVQWLQNNLGPISVNHFNLDPPNKHNLKNNLGDLISHYKLFSESFCVPVGEDYAAVESPNGEFGIYLVSDGSNKPYRIKIRSASFNHLAGLKVLLKNTLLTDLPMLLSSQNFSISEIDR